MLGDAARNARLMISLRSISAQILSTQNWPSSDVSYPSGDVVLVLHQVESSEGGELLRLSTSAWHDVNRRRRKGHQKARHTSMPDNLGDRCVRPQAQQTHPVWSQCCWALDQPTLLAQWKLGDLVRPGAIDLTPEHTTGLFRSDSVKYRDCESEYGPMERLVEPRPRDLTRDHRSPLRESTSDLWCHPFWLW